MLTGLLGVGVGPFTRRRIAALFPAPRRPRPRRRAASAREAAGLPAGNEASATGPRCEAPIGAGLRTERLRHAVGGPGAGLPAGHAGACQSATGTAARAVSPPPHTPPRREHDVARSATEHPAGSSNPPAISSRRSGAAIRPQRPGPHLSIGACSLRAHKTAVPVAGAARCAGGWRLAAGGWRLAARGSRSSQRAARGWRLAARGSRLAARGSRRTRLRTSSNTCARSAVGWQRWRSGQAGAARLPAPLGSGTSHHPPTQKAPPRAIRPGAAPCTNSCAYRLRSPRQSRRRQPASPSPKQRRHAPSPAARPKPRRCRAP